MPTYLADCNQSNLWRKEMFKGLGISTALIIGGMLGLPAAMLAMV